MHVLSGLHHPILVLKNDAIIRGRECIGSATKVTMPGVQILANEGKIFILKIKQGRGCIPVFIDRARGIGNP